MGAEVATATTGIGLVAAASAANLSVQVEDVADDDFSPAEEEEAISTNIFMAW